MIKTTLDIKEYCTNCPNFSAEHEQVNHFAAGVCYDSDVIVYCKWKDHCKHLMKELKEDKKC